MAAALLGETWPRRTRQLRGTNKTQTGKAANAGGAYSRGISSDHFMDL